MAKKNKRLDPLFSSASPEWITPEDVLERVYEVLGTVDCDPCSNIPNPAYGEKYNVKADVHFTKERDGLKEFWYGNIFMNPPYGRTIGTWVEKIIREYKADRTTEAILLMPARTDTRWWQLLRGYPICFVEGRLTFTTPHPGPEPACMDIPIGELTDEEMEQVEFYQKALELHLHPTSAPFPSVLFYMGLTSDRFYAVMEGLGSLYRPVMRRVA